MHLLKNKKALTLIEILIVIAIISILAGVVVVNQKSSVSKSRDTKRLTEVNSVADAFLVYVNANEYPKEDDIWGGSVCTGDSDVINTYGDNWSSIPPKGRFFICMLRFLKSKNYISSIMVQDPLAVNGLYYEFEMGDEFPAGSGVYNNFRIRTTLENDFSGQVVSKGKFALPAIDPAGTGCEMNNPANGGKHYYCVGDNDENFNPGKPVIYLYPEETLEVSVKISPKAITNSIPKYGEGWDVIANPDGKLFNIKDQKEYPYLFWDGKSEKPVVNRKEGFVVKSDEVELFLRDKLKAQGINENEANDFIEFWAPRMKNKSYAYVYFMPQSDYDKLVPMDIAPKPDTVIRVYMLFKSLDEPIQVEQQKLMAPKREGFAVVEWGGQLGELK